MTPGALCGLPVFTQTVSLTSTVQTQTFSQLPIQLYLLLIQPRGLLPSLSLGSGSCHRWCAGMFWIACALLGCPSRRCWGG